MTTLPTMHPLVSSNVKSVGHDGTDLFVTFTTGATYRYPGAAAHHVERMKDADSPGRYFIDNVRHTHKAERVG